MKPTKTVPSPPTWWTPYEASSVRTPTADRIKVLQVAIETYESQNREIEARWDGMKHTTNDFAKKYLEDKDAILVPVQQAYINATAYCNGAHHVKLVTIGSARRLAFENDPGEQHQLKVDPRDPNLLSPAVLDLFRRYEILKGYPPIFARCGRNVWYGLEQCGFIRPEPRRIRYVWNYTVITRVERDGFDIDSIEIR